MQLRDAIRNAPTTREYLRDPVDLAVIARVLDDARFAPSGGNRQGWRVIVVADAERRRALNDLYLPHWDAYQVQTGAAEVLQEPEQADPQRLRRVRRSDAFARSLYEVPVHLVVCVRIADMLITDAELDRPSIVGGASIYPFVQNILLALRGEELGAALTTLLVAAEAQVKELLGIPDELAVAAYIAVGRPAKAWPRTLTRRPVAEFAYLDRFGDSLPGA